ncbi:MAG: radical SAM protein [Lachnospiraceae bacterium]|nr:radical SAM protein [Lachnospiraceae bacterium]
MKCNQCPRHCLVDRQAGKIGYCGETDAVRIGRAALHPWEEPVISGKNGSGTVFFSGCNLRCIYCQNVSIANGQVGRAITIEELAEIFLQLQEEGAHNINLVTPSHYTEQIRIALELAKKKGLHIPIVYNTGGYDSVESLRTLEGLIDIYLPDMKYANPELAWQYSHAKDYLEINRLAIAEMVRQAGLPQIEASTGLMRKGVIVRHLVLPGSVKNSKKVLEYLINTYKNDIFVSIMNQYTPMEQVKEHPLLSRKVTKREYQKVIGYALELGLENGFLQEGETATASFIPEFSET